MKQMNITQKVIGENTFFLKPFAAFTAANISGDLVAMFAPIAGALAAPIVGELGEDTEKSEKSVMDTEIDKVLPAFSGAFSSLSGDKCEKLMRRLLIDHQNISVVYEGSTQVLDMDIANEVFCGDVQDMYLLCYEVIKLNYKGFFKKIGGRFGPLLESMTRKPPVQVDGELSM